MLVVKESVVRDEEGTLSGRSKVIVVLGGVVGFVNDLTRVSDVRDEVVEKRNDCPVESDGARETYHGGLRVHDYGLHRQEHRHPALGEVVGISVSVVISNHVVVALDRNLVLCLDLCLLGHLHGIFHPHAHVRVDLDDLDGRSDGTSRSCRLVPFVRGDAPRRQL